MAEGVVGADRDHRQPGPRAVKQSAEAGVGGAVVSDLEDVDRARVDRHRFGLGIGGQQDREAVPAGEDDEGELVRVRASGRVGDELGRRPEDFEAETAGADRAPGRDLDRP
ncbi:MAG TPA: hypothetical protein VGG40_01285, partial [Solirubrobacterales bacterium]